MASSAELPSVALPVRDVGVGFEESQLRLSCSIESTLVYSSWNRPHHSFPVFLHIYTAHQIGLLIVLWHCLKAPEKAGKYLRTDVDIVCVLLERRILDGNQEFPTRGKQAFSLPISFVIGEGMKLRFVYL